MWTLSLCLSPCAVSFDLIFFDAPLLILFGSLMDWVQACGLRLISPLLVLPCYLIGFVNADQIMMVNVKRVSMTYIGCSATNLPWVDLTSFYSESSDFKDCLLH